MLTHVVRSVESPIQISSQRKVGNSREERDMELGEEYPDTCPFSETIFCFTVLSFGSYVPYQNRQYFCRAWPLIWVGKEINAAHRSFGIYFHFTQHDTGTMQGMQVEITVSTSKLKAYKDVVTHC